MVRICPNCSTINREEYAYCKTCGNSLEQLPLVEESAQPVQIINPPPLHPYVFAQVPVKKIEYKWNDICSIIGFCSSILGFLWFSVLFLPVGAVTSLLGMRGEKAKGLAIAGFVISILAICLKVGFILYENVMIPEWVISGVF